MAGIVVNGDNQALAGVERSMVDSVVVVFNQPVTLDAGAFTIAIHPGVTVDGGSSPGTALPTLAWSSGDGGISWPILFSGSSVVGKSIADGVYDLTTIGSKVHATAGTVVMSGNRVDTIYRLFGDSDGSYTPSGGTVGVNFQASISTADANAFNAALNNTAGYTPVLDVNADGAINSYDNLAFQGRDKTSWTWKATQGTNLVAFTATRYDGADRIAEYLSGDGLGSELSDSIARPKKGLGLRVGPCRIGKDGPGASERPRKR